jgi:hypothetical protein
LPDRNLARRVTADEVVGTWHLTQGSLELFEREGFEVDPDAAYTLVLADGGVATLDSLDDAEPPGRVQRSGTWTLLHDSPRNGPPSRANALEVRVPRADGPGERRVDWGFTEDDGELRIWMFLGDPDTWEFIEYARKP